jgi:hypothetical protein
VQAVPHRGDRYRGTGVHKRGAETDDRSATEVGAGTNRVKGQRTVTVEAETETQGQSQTSRA